MNKKRFIVLAFMMIVFTTLCFGAGDMIAVYNREKISDDISMGLLGVAFRGSFLLPIIAAEISAFFDVVFFLSNNKCKMYPVYALRVIALGLSVITVASAAVCYSGSVNQFSQILLLSSMTALLSVKILCRFLNTAHKKANKTENH